VFCSNFSIRDSGNKSDSVGRATGTNGFVSTKSRNIIHLQDGSCPGCEENDFSDDATIILTTAGIDFQVKDNPKFFPTLQPCTIRLSGRTIKEERFTPSKTTRFISY
jgi:hypothetical protein